MQVVVAAVVASAVTVNALLLLGPSAAAAAAAAAVFSCSSPCHSRVVGRADGASSVVGCAAGRRTSDTSKLRRSCSTAHI